MPVYLSSATLGNDDTLLTIGHRAELMAWFYPHKDHAQQVHQCFPAIFHRQPHGSQLLWTWSDGFQTSQRYIAGSNVLETVLTASQIGLKMTLLDWVPISQTGSSQTFVRRVTIENTGTARLNCGVFHFGDWNLGGIRQGNALRFDHANQMLIQNHREVALAIGGSALETWSCGKAGEHWGNNSKRDLEDGILNRNDLEIGDVCFAFGFDFDLHGGDSIEKTVVFALDKSDAGAIEAAKQGGENWAHSLEARLEHDRKWLAPGLKTLKSSLKKATLPEDLTLAYERCLLALPLLCGREGVAVAAPEFDPEFISCGGYGYFWPRDGGEYVSGLLDAGYATLAEQMFDWCARHQDPSGLWHQRYFLNGAPGPNWCLPPDMLQIDQVGAVLWAFGKWKQFNKAKTKPAHREMIRRAADYLITRQTERGVHGNAFDTWETFIGSFSYSNAAIYSAFLVAHQECGDDKYLQAAQSVKNGMLEHFVGSNHTCKYLQRGFDAHGQIDATIDSSSLGAIEPFGLLDLNIPEELHIAQGTLRLVRERLEVDWMGGRAIRRFEGDAYVGGVPACVNTLWMARCNLLVAEKLRELGDIEDANALRDDAQLYLQTVLRRATPTGLLPELMQGPEGQTWWAAPHGWAMSSFVSGVLALAKQL